MNPTDLDVYAIPKDGYVAFDAMSLRQLIVKRLNDQNVFTDQNFIGSNLASVIDIISYSYHTLIYYLNKTSTESMFTESQLYENMNRIVKILDYSPIGFQTSTLTFSVSVQNFNQGARTIPRYTSINFNGAVYSINEDVTFIKTVPTVVEDLVEYSRLKLLYQGQYQEYPIYIATGELGETLIINTAGTLVDHHNIDVYVKGAKTGVWKKYYKTVNLYLEDGLSEKYEIRINSNKRYEIKFGNDVNGKRLLEDDKVAVYYIESSGNSGIVGADVTSSELRAYNTPQYNEIMKDINIEQLSYIENIELSYFTYKTISSSTLPKTAETAEEIRELAPALYRSQYRLVTASDYEVYVKANFSNLVTDIKVVNNWSYASGYLKYFYDNGITTPFITERALLNQVAYADSCNFNNVYIIIVPRATALSNYNFLLPAQKEFITTAIRGTKMTTTETTFIDPVYKAISFGVKDGTDVTQASDLDYYTLVVRKDPKSRANEDMILGDIIDCFAQYFDRASTRLGSTVSVRDLMQSIYNVNGVDTYKTVNNSTGASVDGLSFMVWNPVYPENDIYVTQNDIKLQYFEYPYFHNIDNLHNKIKVIPAYGSYEPVEY